MIRQQGTLCLFAVLLAVLGCQDPGSLPSEPTRDLRTSGHLVFSDPPSETEIFNALDTCLPSENGLNTAATSRFNSAVSKLNAGDEATAQQKAGELENWLIEKQDRWLCGDQDLAKTMHAIIQFFGLPDPGFDALLSLLQDGGGGAYCLDGQTCQLEAQDENICAGVQIPDQLDPGSFWAIATVIPQNPFPGVYPVYNAWPTFVDLDVTGLEGDFNPEAILQIIAIDKPTPGAPNDDAVAARRVIGHIVFNEATNRDEVELLGEALPIPVCSQAVVLNGWSGWFASLFLVPDLFANPGNLSGSFAARSFFGGVDPFSDTKVGIAPNNTVLNDLQSVTLTATVTGHPDNAVVAGDPIEFLIDGVVASSILTNASGNATLQLTCGTSLSAGEHTVDAHYLQTDTHAESSTTDPDSPTGTATVDCRTAFTPINFDRAPDGKSLKNPEIVNTVYQSLGVEFSRIATATQKCGPDVYAVSDPSTGSFGSPPKVVSLCSSGDSRISANTHGWIQANFQGSGQREVCVAIFPASKGDKGTIEAFSGLDGTGTKLSSKSDQGKQVCVAATGTNRIRSVRFSGDGGKLAKFDNLRFRQ